MKKVFLALAAVAALAACTKSEVAFEQTAAIGFQVVTGKMTKASVEDNIYPENLNMYVFAMTETAAGVANTTADYLDNAEFAKVLDNLWGGWLNGEAYPYYWPNVKKLFFAGVSHNERQIEILLYCNDSRNGIYVIVYLACALRNFGDGKAVCARRKRT